MYSFSELLMKARSGAKYKMKYKTTDKPPSGFEAIAGSKSGGYRKKFGGQWRYWYPWKYSSRVAQHGEYIGSEAHMHVGSEYAISTEKNGEKVETHLEVIEMEGDRVRVKNSATERERWMTKKKFTKLLQDHHAADIASHKEFLKRKVAEAVTTGTAKTKATWFDEAKRYGVFYDGDLDVKDYNATTPPSNISIMLHEDVAPRITKEVPNDVTNFPNANEEEGYYSLFRHQEEGISRILQSWDERDGFVLQDEAGLGKTLTAMGAMIARGGKRNLVVVPTAGGKGLKSQWAETGDLYNLNFKHPREGGDGYFVASYNELFTREEQPDGTFVILLKPEYEGKFDTIVFDEAHKMANPTGQEAQAAVKLQDQAEKVLYMSATPYTNIKDLHYLRKMGWFKTGGEFVEWAEKLGAGVSRRGMEQGAIPFDVKNPRSPLPSVAVAALLHASGGGAKRVPNYAAMTNRQGEVVDLNVNFGKVKASEMDPVYSEAFSAADKVKRLAIEAGLNPLTTGGRIFGWKRQAWEAAKAEQAVSMAIDKLNGDPNAQVLLFTAYTKHTNKRITGIADSIRHRVHVSQTLPESALEYADQIDAIAASMPERDTLKYMTIKLGSHLAGRELTYEEAKEYVGQAHGGADAKEETAAYQRGDKRVIVGTMAKGGTGLSYHDRKGGRPRTQINLTLPLSGADFQQVAGRSYRMGSQSDVDMIWMQGDDKFETHLGELVGKKLANMGALVEGNPGANKTTGELLSWEHSYSIDESKNDEVEDAFSALETATSKSEVEVAKDYFRESVYGFQRGEDVLEAVGLKTATSRNKTRDFRARQAIAKVGTVGIGVSRTGKGLVLRGAEDGSHAHEVLNQLYYGGKKTKNKRAQIGTYNKKNGTWLIRDPADMRKIAKLMGTEKTEVPAISDWSEASLAMAVTGRPDEHSPESRSSGLGDGPFSELIASARAKKDKSPKAERHIKGPKIHQTNRGPAVEIKLTPRLRDEFQALEADTYGYDPDNPDFAQRQENREEFIDSFQSGKWTKEALEYALDPNSGAIDNAGEVWSEGAGGGDPRYRGHFQRSLRTLKKRAQAALAALGGHPLG